MMFVRDTRLQIALTLSTVILISFFLLSTNTLSFSIKYLIELLSITIVTQLVEILFTYLTKRKYFFSYSALITALLIFLIYGSGPLWITLLAGTLAISSKYIIRFKGKHIFNPAAFGIFIAALISGIPPSWWGWGLGFIRWLPLVIIIGSLPVLHRLRRLHIVGGYLITDTILLTILNRLFTPFIFIDPTITLFAYIMLPEPQTTPIVGNWRYIFGVFVSLLTLFTGRLLSKFLIDSFLSALLLADFLSFLIINIKSPTNITTTLSKNV